jgi:hypothetical protein
MDRTVFAFAAALALGANGVAFGAAPAMAQAPNRISQNKAWGSYNFKGQEGTLCYILSIPTQKTPPDRDHGDVFFTLTSHPGQTGSLEPQFMVGYAFRDDSKVSVEIDAKKFQMFTKGNNAWLENPAEEGAVVEAMKTGKSMVLTAESRRGTKTVYTFLLGGVSASLKDIGSCK